jgi:hypothetical protein
MPGALQGNFGPVLTLAEEFKKFLKNPSDTEIDEWQVLSVAQTAWRPS